MKCLNKDCDYQGERSSNCSNFKAVAWDNCTGRIKPSPTLTWKDVLYCHSLGFHTINSFWSRANSLQYPYFCWNDRIYLTYNGSDTGLTIQDIV